MTTERIADTLTEILGLLDQAGTEGGWGALTVAVAELTEVVAQMTIEHRRYAAEIERLEHRISELEARR